MATKNRQSPTNPNAVYAVMTAGAIAVLALVGWALYRSFNVPVSSTLATPSANTAVSPATSATVTAADDEAAKAALPRISAEELHQRIARNEITLIDVRTKDGWDSGHIGGAIHIPLASVESYLSYIPRDKPIVTYCTWPNEESSAGAALIMQHAGINNVSALKGGLHAWENANYPIVRSSP